MTVAALPIASDAVGDRGVVGTRRLVAVQTFDIARLTSHPIPIEPGTFVAVSGVGPKGDSNGSGKTSFLAAAALLLADPQWRLTSNGGRDAAGLLFRPGAAGLDPGQQYPAASHGYVIGVFAEPGSGAGGSRSDGALTVWVRVATSAPWVEARWAGGLVVPDADGEADRTLQADEMWASMRTDRASARQMQATLYGDAPRCMTYLDTPLRPAVASLLSQQMTEMTPERIGESLLALCGLTGEMDAEAEQRSELATHQRELADTEHLDVVHTAEEDAELEGVRARDRARDRLAAGRRFWRLHCARGLVEIAAEDAKAAEGVAELQDAVAEAEQELSDARAAATRLRDDQTLVTEEQAAREAKERAEQTLQDVVLELRDRTSQRSRMSTERPSLLAASAGWSGTDVETAAAARDIALRSHAEAAALVTAGEARVAAATEALTAAREGRAGGAGDLLLRLNAAGVQAGGLLATIELSEAARRSWEPRLWPLRDAVVVAPDDAPTALAGTASLPGAQLVLADGPLDAPPGAQLPDGVTAGVPLARFFAVLDERFRFDTDPDRVADDDLRHVVLGGFTAHTTGRAARIAAAEAEVRAATDERDGLVRQAEVRRLTVQATENDVAAADAHERLADLDARAQVLDGEIAEWDAKATAQRAVTDELGGKWQEAFAAKSARDSNLTAAVAVRELRTEQLHQVGAELAEATKARDALDLEHWRQAWDGTLDDAVAYLDAELDEQQRGRSRHTWRNRASDALRDALSAYGVVSADDVADPDLADAVRRREQLAERAPGIARDAVDFTHVADPLQNRLDGHAELDRVTAERVTSQRTVRKTALGELRTEVDARSTSLTAVQDMIERVIEARLSAIHTALNRLDLTRGGFGAELLVQSVRPDNPTSQWHWRVTPRWKRGPASDMVSYREVANGAQVKVFAVQLVLAALLAAEGGEGRVLILDELGNSLGEVNRKDVLGALRSVATEQQVTILGTCQDSVLSDAADYCGQVLWFTHASASDAFNQPVRTWGHTDDGELVEMTRDWLTTGRPVV